MAKKTLIIEQTGEVLQIERKGLWSNVSVTLDGCEVGRFKSLKDLKQGQTLKTPIGDIFIELTRSGFNAFYDSERLEGSESDPANKWQIGYKVAIGLGLFNIGIGVLSLVTQSRYLFAMGVTPLAAVFGVALLLLGLWSREDRSTTALVIAALIFGADGVLTLFAMGIRPNTWGLLIRAYFVYLMAQGAREAAEVLPEYSEKAKNS